MQTTTLGDLVAAQPASALALIDGPQRVTYGELNKLCQKMAGGLRSIGFSAGDRLALWLPNSVEYAVLLLACARIGVVAVALNTRFRSTEVGDIVRRANCRGIVLWPTFLHIDFQAILTSVEPGELCSLRALITVRANVDQLLVGVEQFSFEDLASHCADSLISADPELPSHLFTTSGTTSAPKLVQHCQPAVLGHGADVARVFQYTAGTSVLLQATPLCGVYGFSQFVGGLSAGIATVLMSVFAPETAIDHIRREKVTQFNGTDDMLDQLLHADPERTAFRSMDFFGCANFNPGFESIGARAIEHGLRISGLFGMSEVHALFALQNAALELDERRLGGGLAVSPAADIRIRDSQTGVLLATGETGSIEILTPNIMLGYLGDPQATAAAMTDDGYFITGDIGYLRVADRSLVFLARAGDLLRIGGFLVSPREIESCLDAHPQIAAVQVADGVRDNKRLVVAFVQRIDASPAIDEAELGNYCRQRIASFKVPHRFVEVDHFPQTEGPNGLKIKRHVLAEWAAKVLAEDPL